MPMPSLASLEKLGYTDMQLCLASDDLIVQSLVKYSCVIETQNECLHSYSLSQRHGWRIVKTPGGAFRLVTVQFLA